jgi:AcrR family transcriptional regulator
MARPTRARTYDASRRQKRALESQDRILEAARELYSSRGYAETRIEDIAAAAGVSTPTVYAAFQSKRGILDALMRRLVAGVPGGPPLVETEGPRAINAEPNARRALAMFVPHLLGVQDRVIPTYEVLKNAARTEPEVGAILGKLQDYRLANLRTLAVRLAQLEALRNGLSVDDAARTLWAICSPEVRQMLLVTANWSRDAYAAWLEDTLAAALLKPAAQRSTK